MPPNFQYVPYEDVKTILENAPNDLDLNVFNETTDEANNIQTDEDDFEDEEYEYELYFQDEVDDDPSVATFEANGVIYCFDLNKEGTLAVTGHNWSVYVWDAITGAIWIQINVDNSPKFVEFNNDSKYLTVVEFDGNLQVWDIVTKNLIWHFTGERAIWLLWFPSSYSFLTSYDCGEIYLWKCPEGSYTVIPADENSCTCGVIQQDEINIFAGYTNGHVIKWNISTSSNVLQFNHPTNNDPSESITSLSLNHDGNLLVVGNTSRKPIVLKTDNFDIVANFESYNDLMNFTLLSSEPQSYMIATGNSRNGHINFWDLSSNSLNLTNTLLVAPFISHMCWSSDGMLFVSSTAQNKVHVINGRTAQLVKTLQTGHRGLDNFKISRNGQVLLTVASTDSVKVYNIHI